MLKKIALTIAALMIATPAVATDYSKGDDCNFGNTYEALTEGGAPTVLFFSQDQGNFDRDDAVMIYIVNDDWSIAEGDKLGRIRLSNDEGAWLENEAFAGKNAFLLETTFEHFNQVFGTYATSLIVTRGDTTIDRLKLSVLFSDLARFKSCRAKKVAVKEEVERKEGMRREIPKDPFAK